jgi:homocysteine S-methyltransferase
VVRSYQTSTDGFKSIGYTEEEGVRFMRRSVELAVQARDEYIQTDAFKQSGRDIPVVGLSLGSYGAMLCGGEEYSGLSPLLSHYPFPSLFAPD